MFRAVAFSLGALSLELSGSLFHGYVVKDVSWSLGKMLGGDALVSVLCGAALLGWQAVLPKRDGGRSRAFLAWLLGFVFALLLELLNDAFPGALLTPRSLVTGLAVWTCFLVGTLGASAILSGVGRLAGEKSRRVGSDA